MKFFAVLCLAWLFFIPAKAQLSKAFTEGIVPCAMEVGIHSDDLRQVQSGNFAGALGQWNCLSDCLSLKHGIVSDSYAFLPDAFKEKLALFVLPERADEFMEKCGGKAGEGKCKASGEFYHCVLNLVMDGLFS